MAGKLTRADLLSLEDYHEQRPQMRREVMAHKANRRVCINTHAALYFEDQLTVRYQIQEMLRVERIYQREGIDDELAAYNPLIPDGSNLKATFMLEYDDVEERRAALERLRGIEDQVWFKVGEGAPVYAIADEDLERENETKTSAVHFLRFELDQNTIAQWRAGAAVSIGISHAHFTGELVPLPTATATALLADID